MALGGHARQCPGRTEIGSHSVEQRRDLRLAACWNGTFQELRLPAGAVGGITSRRATELAASMPKSCRTISIRRSMPAALPAEVKCARASGRARRRPPRSPETVLAAPPHSASASSPCRRPGGPSPPERTRPNRWTPAAHPVVGSAEAIDQIDGNGLVRALPAGDDDDVGLVEEVDAVLGRHHQPAMGAQRPVLDRATRETIPALAHLRAGRPKTSATIPNSKVQRPS